MARVPKRSTTCCATCLRPAEVHADGCSHMECPYRRPLTAVAPVSTAPSPINQLRHLLTPGRRRF